VSLEVAGDRAFVGNRPFARIDDEIGRDDPARARRHPAPTMPVRVEGTHGLRDVHVGGLEAFAEAVGTTEPSR
jgi:hypothetical protein